MIENDKSAQPDQIDSLELAKGILKLLDDKKATDLRLLNLERVNPYFCYFLIATAGSSTQLKTLSREIQRQFGKHLPGKSGAFTVDDLASGWVVLDFIDVVVHLFLPEQRSYYNLEKLWGDAGEVNLEDSLDSDSTDEPD